MDRKKIASGAINGDEPMADMETIYIKQLNQTIASGVINNDM